MSAVIAIMNKHGVALAADSAVTISGGDEKKIYQNANKVFTLSKFHPVGIMILPRSQPPGWECLQGPPGPSEKQEML